MSRIIPITLSEFLYLVEYAQKRHAEQNEPIPQVHESQYPVIQSCLDAPYHTWDGKLLYKGFYKKAALLFYVLNKNHPLSNGNKRMACLTLAYFCEANRHSLKLPPNDFYDIAKMVTISSGDSKDAILEILANMLKNVCK